MCEPGVQHAARGAAIGEVSPAAYFVFGVSFETLHVCEAGVRHVAWGSAIGDVGLAVFVIDDIASVPVDVHQPYAEHAALEVARLIPLL